ncbi:MAG: DUF1836 domain-containing protein [Acholeplasmataceae bacterium]|nr:DUF1836 domain-containing protein [Acholeplasmataceae bacterium]
MDIEIKDWMKRIQNIHLPRYDELPVLSLYLDQVLEYVNENIGIIFISQDNNNGNVLTASMINNYVKNNIMPAPQKKRYSKDHIAFIITITVLKQIGTLSDVSQGIKHLTSVLGKVDAYNAFISFLENALKSTIMELEQTPDLSYFQTPVDLDLLPLKSATIAFASIMMSQYLLKKIPKGEIKK